MESRSPHSDSTQVDQPNEGCTDIQKSFQAMQACIAYAPISIFRIDEAGKIIDVNIQACTSLGYMRDELIGMTVFELDPTFTPDRWKEHRKNLKLQGSRLVESRHRRKDGTTFPVEVKVNFYEFNGEQYSYSFAQDITERRKSEQALKASENRFRMLSEASFEGIAISKEGIFIDINDQFAQMLGYTRHELIGTQMVNCIAPQDRLKVAEIIRSYDLAPYELLSQRKDGTQFPAKVHARYTTLDGEEVRVSVVRDISEQKQAEVDLRRLGFLEEKAMQMSRIAHWEYDIASSYFTFNDQCYALFGTTAEKAGGYLMSAMDFAQKYVYPEDVYLFQGVIQSAIETQDRNFNSQVEARILKANGELIYSDTWFRIEKDENGGTIKLFGVSQDITERKKAMAAIQDSMKLFKVIFANAPIALFGFDRNGICTLSEGRRLREFGIDPNSIQGKSVFDIFKDTPLVLNKIIKRALAGETFSVSYPVNDHYFQAFQAPLYDNQGEFNGSVGIIMDITEQRQAEASLREREELLRLVLEATSDAVWDFNIREDRYYFSPRFYSMLGYEPDEFPATFENWWDLLHPDFEAEALKTIQCALDDHSSFASEYPMKTKGGDWCWVLARGKVVQTDEKDRAIRMVGSNTDITKRKNTEIALQQSENQLRLLTDNMVDVVIRIDDKLNILYASPSVMRVFDLKPADMIGKNLGDWVQPEDAQFLQEAVDAAFLINAPSINLEYRWRNAQGRYLWIESSTRILYDESGNPSGGILISRDITERKRAELLLRGLNAAALAMQRAVTPKEIFSAAAEQLKSLGFYCAMFKVNQDRISLTPVHLTYKSASIQKLERLTGLRATSAIIPIQVMDGFRLPIIEKRTRFIENLMPSMQQFLAGPLSRLAKPMLKTLGVFKTINAPLIIDNDVIGLLSVQSDELNETDVPAITAFANQMAAAWRKAQLFDQAHQEILARSEAEEKVRHLNDELEKRVTERTAQLKAANAELEAFAYSVSHDLRAPLRAINGYTSILVEDYEPIFDDEGKRVCSVIRNEAAHMGELIDDLLAFSRLGKAEMNIVPVDMNALLNSVYQELTISEDLTRIKFHKSRLADVEADHHLLRQVWMNLLSNALKYSRNCPVAKIEVGCNQEKDKITYWVRDNGVGFDMNFKHKLFGVFQRLHSADEFEGTGVGLAIVQRIVHRHGGEVWAIGEIGHGATFSFSLPKKGKLL